MSQSWADETAQQLLSRDLIQAGICLILGAADTGKTTLAAALAKHTTSNQPIGIVDADIGQSHIGPPATVGWALAPAPATEAGLADDQRVDLTQLAVGGMSFVGDVTPVGHLLQLTAAVVQCVKQVSKVAMLTIIDTPGFINGSTAQALWWAVQRLLQPELILAVQKNDELSEILAGLQSFALRIELVKSPAQIPLKSPQERRNYRQRQFSNYFRGSYLYNISLSQVAVQIGRNLSRDNLTNRLIGLSDGKGIDIAIGLIMDWQNDKGIVAVRTPKIDIHQVRCVMIGDLTLDITDE